MKKFLVPIQHERPVYMKENSAPSTPSSGYGAVYAKTDGQLYYLNDDGIEVPLGNSYSVFVYNSSATPAANLYSDWTKLMNDIHKQYGRIIIAGQQNETISSTNMPTAGWNFDNCEFWGTGEDGSAAASGSATWTFPTGVKIASWEGLKVINYGMYFKSTSNAAILTLTTNATLTVMNVAGIGATTAPFISTSANFVLAGQGNARLKNAGYEIVAFTGSAMSQQAIVNFGNGTAADSNIIRSTNGQITVYVLSTDVMDASLYPPTNTNMNIGYLVLVNFIYSANIQYNVRTSTAGSVTCSKAYSYERANATGGGVTYTLPPALGLGYRLSFKKIDSSGNAMTVNRAGSDTIDGATSKSTSTQYDGFTLQDVASGVWDVVK